jgi:hypothetical protein
MKFVAIGMILVGLFGLTIFTLDAIEKRKQLVELRREPTTTEILDSHLNHELEARNRTTSQKIETIKRFNEMHSWMVANGVPRTSIISVGETGVEVKLAYPWYDTFRDREVTTYSIDTPHLAAKCVADYQNKFRR